MSSRLVLNWVIVDNTTDVKLIGKWGCTLDYSLYHACMYALQGDKSKFTHYSKGLYTI